MKMPKEFNNKFIRNTKIKKILFKVIYIISVMAILYNVIYLVNTIITKKEYLDIFNMKLICINDDLMKDDLRKNDIAIICKTEEVLKVGDIIAYEIEKETKISKIFNIYTDQNSGETIYITKYNKNYNPNMEKITYEQIIGKKVSKVIGLGVIVKILQSKITTIFIILILILYFFYNKKQMERLKIKKSRK